MLFFANLICRKESSIRQVLYDTRSRLWCYEVNQFLVNHQQSTQHNKIPSTIHQPSSSSYERRFFANTRMIYLCHLVYSMAVKHQKTYSIYVSQREDALFLEPLNFTSIGFDTQISTQTNGEPIKSQWYSLLIWKMQEPISFLRNGVSLIHTQIRFTLAMMLQWQHCGGRPGLILSTWWCVTQTSGVQSKVVTLFKLKHISRIFDTMQLWMK